MNKRYAPDFWKHHIQKWEESNSPIETYCKTNNLVSSTFHKWKKQFSVEKVENGFIEIPLKESEPLKNLIEFTIDEFGNLNIKVNINSVCMRMTKC